MTDPTLARRPVCAVDGAATGIAGIVADVRFTKGGEYA
jgi:hypothetical protein